MLYEYSYVSIAKNVILKCYVAKIILNYIKGKIIMKLKTTNTLCY